MAKQLLLVGDSNVRRYFDRLSGAYGAEVDFVQSRKDSEWLEAVPNCKKGYRIVTYSFLTNIIIDAARDGTSDDERVDLISPVLKTILMTMKWVLFAFISVSFMSLVSLTSVSLMDDVFDLPILSLCTPESPSDCWLLIPLLRVKK